MTSHTRWLWWCLPALLVGCGAEAEDGNLRDLQAGLVCGMEVLPSPQTLPDSSCEMGRTVFGPARFERDRGAPAVQAAGFAVASAGPVCVTIRNGGDDADPRVSSGTVKIGDDSVAAPSDFSQQVELLEEEIDLGIGEHELKVEVASAPGSYIEVEVREAFAQIGGSVVTTNSDGSLRLTNVATDHPLLTPNGDGHHDDTVFNADVEPLNTLPGKDAGLVDYFLEWEFSVIDLDGCGAIDTGITGTTQVNSPTNVSTTWDGTDINGLTVPSGNYAYVFNVTLVDEFGAVFGAVESPAYGMVVDGATATFDEMPEHLGACDPGTDPTNCLCPGSGGIPGAGDPNCSFGMVQHLMDYAGWPPGTQPNFYDASIVDKSFLTTNYDAASGRYTVTADLRSYSAGGLIPKGDGVWDSETDLRQWVADMTGVPLSTGDSLFNFDFVQLGTSTGVNLLGVSNHSFNHFFLDALTDDDGKIVLNGGTTDLSEAFNDDGDAPALFALVNARLDDECTESANSNGVDSLRAKFCAHNTAVSVGDVSDLGVYALRSTLFGLSYNGEGTTQDELCLINGIFSCGIRTVRVPADTVEVEANYYVESSGDSIYSHSQALSATDVASVGLTADRGAGADGVCARAVATKGGLAVRLDSADGSVPGTCLINGVFP